MSLRVIFDESHGELLSVSNCRGIAYVLEKLKIIPFRLISAPLTIDKIASEDVLFLGAPTRKFLDIEMKAVKFFVSKGKFLIVACPVPISFNLSLNELIKDFGMKFEQNIVQDKKHNLNGASYFPLIKHFKTDLITQDLKEIAYSGCSLKKLTTDAIVLAETDDHSEPPFAPVVMSTGDGRVICIGGASLFQDDKRTGIKTKNNIRFVANLFRAIMKRTDQTGKKLSGIQSNKIKKQKLVDHKKAKKYFEKLTNDAIINLNKKSDDIDNLFDAILQLIESKNFQKAEETLKTYYKKYKRAIEDIFQEPMEKLKELNSRIRKEIDFPTFVKECSDQLLVVESETLSKLDMIRFNLSNRISKEKLRF
ncbi:MAG: hypothetical protein ACFFD2_09430 [Promethearchaeota archaeon]